MSLKTALAKAITEAIEAEYTAVWFEDELPNKDKSYPQVTMDSSYATKIDTKMGWHEYQTAQVSVWFENGISAARAADTLSLAMFEAVHLTTYDGVWICAEQRDEMQEKDTGLNRWRMTFELQRVSAS